MLSYSKAVRSYKEDNTKFTSIASLNGIGVTDESVKTIAEVIVQDLRRRLLVFDVVFASEHTMREFISPVLLVCLALFPHIKARIVAERRIVVTRA